jgi:hypothetical protein
MRTAGEGTGTTDYLCRSLDRLIGYEDLLFERTSYPGNPAPGHRIAADEALKRLSELTIVLDVARSISLPQAVTERLQVLQWVCVSADRAALGPGQFPDVLPTAQVLLYSSTFERSKLDIARAILTDPGFQQLYRDPPTELCYRHLLARSRGSSSFFWFDLHAKLLCHSSLAPDQLRRSDVYAFTHEVFYLTDFGSQRLPEGINRHVIEAVLRCRVQEAFDIRDDDLLMELLLVGRICDIQADSEESLACLADHFDQQWFMRPYHSLFLARVLDDHQRRRYAFAAQYHPLVVWCILLLRLFADGVVDPRRLLSA